MLGFLTGRIIWALQWDHIYSADYFLGLLALLGASLAACTATNQWPAVKVSRRPAVVAAAEQSMEKAHGTCQAAVA